MCYNWTNSFNFCIELIWTYSKLKTIKVGRKHPELISSKNTEPMAYVVLRIKYLIHLCPHFKVYFEFNFKNYEKEFKTTGD